MNTAIEAFLTALPRRIDDVADEDQAKAYQALRALYTRVTGRTADTHFEFTVETVVGSFKAKASVHFTTLGVPQSALLHALKAAGDRGLDAEQLRHATVKCGRLRKRMHIYLDRLINLCFASWENGRCYPTGNGPISAGGKPALVVVEFL
ncbi:MAG: hypothetical protein ABSA13_16050 [Beijerinckiaceae bacterium]